MFLIVCLLMLVIFLGMPVAFCIIGCSVLYSAFADMDLIFLPQQMVDGVNIFPLVAVPVFIFMGSFLVRIKAIDSLLELSKAMIGQVKGNLAYVNILGGTFFAGVQGTALADTAAIGSIFIPTMKKDGYPPSLAAAVTAASSVAGPIVPPSVFMIILGAIANISVGRLFLGGFIPGAVMTIFLMVVAYFMLRMRRDDITTSTQPFSAVRLWSAVWHSLPILFVPVLIVGGIVGGVFTATECASIGAFYSLLLSLFGLGVERLSLKALRESLEEVVTTLGSVMLIVAVSVAFGWILNALKATDVLVHFFLNVSSNPHVTLLVISLLVLLLGCFIDPMALLLMLGGTLASVTAQLGIDPIHFGLVFVLTLSMAVVTPPVGSCMYVSMSIAKISTQEYSKAIWPFLIGLFLALLVIIFIPSVVLWLPNLLMKT